MKLSGRIWVYLGLAFVLGLCAGGRLLPRLIEPGSSAAAGPPLLDRVPDVRQSTTYSCGAAALQALLSYWGIDRREQDLMQTLRTNPEEGTSPEAIVRAATEAGCQAGLKENLDLGDINDSLRRGVPVICAIQAWTDDRPEGFSWDRDWEDGHYVVVIGLDSRSVYVEDPSLLGTRGVIPREDFVARWHDYRGEPPFDPSDRAYIHLGIFVAGRTPGLQPAFTPVE